VKSHFVLLRDNQTPGFGGEGTATKAQSSGSRTDSLVQDCDWFAISIEPDCLVWGIVNHKPNSPSKPGDPFRQSTEPLPHKTHWPFSWVEVDAKEFLDADERGYENRTWRAAFRCDDRMRTKICRQICSRASASCFSANSIC
jgi:hypothetical protein